MIWPLIWAQILMLRAVVRAAYGKGTPYRWSVTPLGRAFIVSIDLEPGQKLTMLKPPAQSNARIAAALDSTVLLLAYTRNPSISAHPGKRRDPDAARTVLAALDPGLRRGERHSWNVPLPET